MQFYPVAPGFASLAVSLKSLYGRDFCAPHNAGHPLAQLLAELMQYHFENDRRSYELCKQHLEMHAKHLREVEAYDYGMFRGFRRKLAKAKDFDSFEAMRFEVDVAASLARKGCQFAKRIA